MKNRSNTMKLAATGIMLTLPLQAMANTQKSGEETVRSKDYAITVEYTPWLVAWEQTSSAAKRFGANSIEVDYEIDATIAHAARLKLSAFGFTYTLETAKAPDDSAQGEKSLSYLAMGVNYSGMTQVELDYQLLQSRFEGFINGTYQGQTGLGTFETDVTIHDIAILTKSGVGMGYRYFDYEVPQDVYLVGPASGNTPISQGFVDMHYKAHYLTALYKNNDIFNTEKQSGVRLATHLRAGIGIIEPNGQFIDDTEQLLRASQVLSSGQRIMDDGTTWFTEVDINAHKRYDITRQLSGTIGAGYRVNYMEASFDHQGDYSLVADFETLLHGPYVEASLRF